ncbi:MAG: threonine synthase [Planctomycetota bacterium]|nr:threonine synthase [Planctomycetota bacterium]
MDSIAHQVCLSADCRATYASDEVLFKCTRCGSLLDVIYDWNRAAVPDDLRFFESRWSTAGRQGSGRLDFSGVWRFRELLPFAEPAEMVTIGEGRTILQQAELLGCELGIKPGHLFLQYEGMNPSGSFKDNGMAAAFTMARRLAYKRVACASTGNTSASMALYASAGSTPDHPVQAIVFVGSGKIAFGKLSQALDYGARTLQIDGDFDDCMKRVQEAAAKLNLYLMNSMNPYRLEGQKTIMYRVLEGLDWEVPDWIIVPGGNLGNSSAFGKAWLELKELGLVSRVPRLAIINAAGANTLHTLFNNRGLRWNDGRIDQSLVSDHFRSMDAAGYKAKTVASAIEIAKPVNLSKALRALAVTDGVVREVDDETILDHKALIGRYGFGCEPASAASVAGLRLLLEEQVIDKDQRVVCILTGHELKDPDATVRYHAGDEESSRPPARQHANAPVKVADDLDAICEALSTFE